MAEEANVVIRRDNPGLGQGHQKAISARTAWEYEHDETDEQIDAIEKLIIDTRNESGAATDNDGRDDVTGHVLKGATFSWNVEVETGDVVISTQWTEPGEGVVNLGSKGILEASVWVNQVWRISRDGTVTEV